MFYVICDTITGRWYETPCRTLGEAIALARHRYCWRSIVYAYVVDASGEEVFNCERDTPRGLRAPLYEALRDAV